MKSYSLGIGVSAVALVADQILKALVLTNAETLAAGVSVFPSFNLIFHRNYGVTFGFFKNVPWWGLALIATAIVLFLAVSLVRSTRKSEAVAYGLIIGGALGNIADRFRFGGVTDFLDLYIGTAHWPTFNLADVFILCGAGLVLIVSSRDQTLAAKATE